MAAARSLFARAHRQSAVSRNPDHALRGVTSNLGAGTSTSNLSPKESNARSFKQHGFLNVVLIGDHGGYQAQLKTAMRLNRDWIATPARAHFIGDYYRVTETDFAQALRARGLSDMQIGTHAGTADTSLMMAINSALVRPEQIPRDPREGLTSGVAGDPRASSIALGQLGVDLIITKTVAAIQASVNAKR